MTMKPISNEKNDYSNDEIDYKLRKLDNQVIIMALVGLILMCYIEIFNIADVIIGIMLICFALGTVFHRRVICKVTQ